jgi:hypothetical protein
VDDFGNVHVAGSSYDGASENYVTIKYDGAGNQLWIAEYDGPASAFDQARAIVLDGLGNAYVTGRSNNGTSDDYATVKYDSAGNQLWVASYDGPAAGDDGAVAIALDGLGNVYVTGYSWGSGWDYATIKYDSGGSQLWVARYAYPTGGDDRPAAIAVDGFGNVYVAGHTQSSGSPSGSYYDYATVKYDSYGNQLWLRLYNSPQGAGDRATAMALDSSANIYVTGTSADPWWDDDYATIKYDSAGNQLWIARYEGPAGFDDEARAIALDGLGHVYVTGNSYNGTSDDYATVKYDSAGNQLWVARYEGPANLRDYANGIAVDSLGNAYVTGQSESSPWQWDFATVKYDGEIGSQLWSARYDGPPNGSDWALAIAVGGSGYVYVTGWSEGLGTGKDYTTIKYAQESAPAPPRVEIVEPQPNDVFWIEAEPEPAMPIIRSRARIVGVTPDPTPVTRFSWQAECEYTTTVWTPAYEDGEYVGGTYLAHRFVYLFPPEGPKGLEGEAWNIDFRNTFCGGTLTVSVTASIAGNELRDSVTVYIRGRNPNKETVKEALLDEESNIILQAVSFKESTFRQFTDGVPLYGAPGGYGLMQIDVPPNYFWVRPQGHPSNGELREWQNRLMWNWRYNIDQGRRTFQERLAMSREHVRDAREKYPRELVRNLSQEEHERQAASLYNAYHHYYMWNVDAQEWEAYSSTDNPGKDYADAVMQVKWDVMAGTPPAGW